MMSAQQSRISAMGTILLAIVVGCVSEPVKQTGANPEATTSSTATSLSTATPSETSATATASSSAPSKSTAAVGNEAEPGASNASPGPDDADTPTGTLKSMSEVEEDIIVDGKKLSIPKITGSVPLRDDDYHDTDNNAIVVLQNPTKAMADFPRDRRNEVDWVKTLDQGFIEPRADLKGESKMVTLDMDILMKNTQFMPWVRFPHIAHTKWLACDNCHPKIFIPKENANPISMNKVLRGEYCGVCHDKVAFSLFICERCHSVPHEGSGPAWWK